MYKIFGINNCNTVKKALNHLDKAGIAYEFINFKKNPPTKQQIQDWKQAFGDWPVNKRGPTFRKIKDEFEAASSPAKINLLIEKNSAIKRPILMKKSKVILFGYSEQEYDELS